MVGVLFLLAMFFSPLAAVIPAQATAPALILVGFYMMTIVREIPWDDYEEAVPAFVTMLAMPYTWSITNGIGAGFITYAAIKLLNGKARQVHWMVYLASAAFLLYFALPLIERAPLVLGGGLRPPSKPPPRNRLRRRSRRSDAR